MRRKPDASAGQQTPLRRVLSNAAFRRLFIAQTISRWGDTFNAVALVLLVYRLTGSGVTVAATVAFEAAPILVLSFAAGAVVDRCDRRTVMITADLARAVVLVALIVLQHHVWAVYAAAFALSSFAVFFNPAAASLTPTLVAEGDLIAANSAIWSVAVISQIALAPVAGSLVAWAGAGPAFAINAASFLASTALLTRLPLQRATPTPTGRRRLGDVADGIRAIRHSRFLTVLTAVQALAALSAGATSALLVVLAQRHLDLEPSQFGLLLAAIGVGAGLGPLVVLRTVSDARKPGWLFGPYLLRGVVDLTLAATTSFAVALVALTAYGVGTSTGNITYNTVLQTAVPDRLRGRVFAFYDIVWQTARLVSIAIGGWAADRFGIASLYAVGGLLLLAVDRTGFRCRRTDPRACSPRRRVAHFGCVGGTDHPSLGYSMMCSTRWPGSIRISRRIRSWASSQS